jgi:hypothetical protein
MDQTFSGLRAIAQPDTADTAETADTSEIFEAGH